VVHIKVSQDYKTLKDMKKKMTQEQLEWNKKFLTEEWDYCIHLINKMKEELNGHTLEEHKGLSEQHDFMGIIRHTIGKGWWFYNQDKTTNTQRDVIDHTFLTIHRMFDTMEQN
jgi:hypothetical protein